MRAVFQHGIRDLRLMEMDVPIPGAGEVLLKTRAVTICASDIHMYAEGNVGGVTWDRPFVPGHEIAAVIQDPNGSDWEPGTPVVVDPAVPCKHCDLCATGNFHLCRNLKFCDLPPVDGGMREFFTWPADRIFPLPSSVDLVEAPLIEPLCIAVHTVNLVSMLSDAVVAVVGCGAIGLFTIQMAWLRGARSIFATDLIPERLAIAAELGADATFKVGPQDPVKEIMQATDGRGVDIAFEAAGPPEAVQQCLDLVRSGGEVAIIGIPSVDEYRLSPSQLRRHELTLRFVRRQNENYPEAIALVRDGRIRTSPLLTHRVPVERVNEAFELAENKDSGAVRVAVTFD